MVAMFKYSPVLTYSVSLPSQKMQFNYSGGGEFLKKDSENVCTFINSLAILSCLVYEASSKRSISPFTF